MSRLLMIGLDGFDPELLERWAEDLPTFTRLRREGRYARLRSVFPPDSIPAWITIYTGLSPAEHGIIHSIDYLDRRHRQLRFNTQWLRGRTFWDVASSAGKRVCVVNPFLAYPPWPVNGVMVSGPVFEGGEVLACPKEVLRRHPPPPMGGIAELPTKRSLEQFYRSTMELTRRQAEFGLTLLREVDWDLFFITFLTPDRVQHFLWRYGDPRDPTYPGPNSLGGAIRDMYRAFDGIIREFVREAGGASVLILSDHGHGMRCPYQFNLKEYLRRQGLVDTGVKVPWLSWRYWLERAKFFALMAIYRFNLEPSWLLKLIPAKKALKETTFLGSGESLVSVPNLDGSNPYGGIKLHEENIRKRGLDPQRFREELMRELASLRDGRGMPVFEWVRESQSRGVFPQLLFKLREEYGVGWNLFVPLFTVNPTHKRISGGHRQEGILILHNAPDVEEVAELQQIPNLALRLLGLSHELPIS